jgi:hypothetical protein
MQYLVAYIQHAKPGPWLQPLNKGRTVLCLDNPVVSAKQQKHRDLAGKDLLPDGR